MPIITARHCEAKVSQRKKFYDNKCHGLYVSVVPSGVATFYFKFTDHGGKRQTLRLGSYHADEFTVQDARTAFYRLKGQLGLGEDIVTQARHAKAQRIKQGKTVNQIIDERILWISTPERKPDGELRPRIESWQNAERLFDRFVRPRLGKMIASAVTKHDIAQLSNDIVEGELGVPSISNARHVRRALSALFNWAAEAGRDYVTTSPCVNLPPLAKEHPRTRVLSEDEIRTLWHGLDREDMVWDRRTRLALKFELVTMLRSGELLPIHVSELVELDGSNPRVDIPLKRVKKRRVIQQPLSDLAVEIIREALTDDGQEFVFQTPQARQPLHRHAMATALRGRPDKGIPGICECLGLKPFTPHDLRRTAATLAGDLGCDEAAIAKCLDHAVSRKGDAIVPTVTGKVYNHSPRMQEKRAVFDKIGAELRRIIGANVVPMRRVREAR
jgi:integrase